MSSSLPAGGILMLPQVADVIAKDLCVCTRNPSGAG